MYTYPVGIPKNWTDNFWKSHIILLLIQFLQILHCKPLKGMCHLKISLNESLFISKTIIQFGNTVYYVMEVWGLHFLLFGSQQCLQTKPKPFQKFTTEFYFRFLLSNVHSANHLWFERNYGNSHVVMKKMPTLCNMCIIEIHCVKISPLYWTNC